MHPSRKWQPTPVFLPGESQGRGSLVGCRLWGHTESDTTEVMQQQQQQVLLGSLVPPVQCGPSSGPPVTLFGSDQCNRLWITIRRVPVETSGIIGTTHVTCLGFSYLIVEFYKDRASLCDACHQLVSLVCLLPCPRAPGLLPGGLWVCS